MTLYDVDGNHELTSDMASLMLMVRWHYFANHITLHTQKLEKSQISVTALNTKQPAANDQVRVIHTVRRVLFKADMKESDSFEVIEAKINLDLASHRKQGKFTNFFTKLLCLWYV